MIADAAHGDRHAITLVALGLLCALTDEEVLAPGPEHAHDANDGVRRFFEGLCAGAFEDRAPHGQSLRWLQQTVVSTAIACRTKRFQDHPPTDKGDPQPMSRLSPRGPGRSPRTASREA